MRLVAILDDVKQEIESDDQCEIMEQCAKLFQNKDLKYPCYRVLYRVSFIADFDSAMYLIDNHDELIMDLPFDNETYRGCYYLMIGNLSDTGVQARQAILDILGKNFFALLNLV